MWWLVLTLTGALGLVAVGIAASRTNYRQASLGWRLLAHAGWPLSLAGALFVLRFWVPTSGPYRANVRYPFGSHLNAYAVSFGFTWMAFGVLFSALAALAPRAMNARPAWFALLMAWMLCWLPHGVIAVAFVFGGTDSRSVEDYRAWGSEPAGALILGTDAVLLLLHLVLSVAGFALAWRGRGAHEGAVNPPAPTG